MVLIGDRQADRCLDGVLERQRRGGAGGVLHREANAESGADLGATVGERIIIVVFSEGRDASPACGCCRFLGRPDYLLLCMLPEPT